MKNSIKHSTKKSRYKYKLKLLLLFTFLISLVLFIFTILFSSYFKINSLRISVNNEVDNIPVDSKRELEDLLIGKNILFFSTNKVSDILLNKYKNIKSINFNRNLDKSLSVIVSLYEVKFIGCAADEGFLVPCMYSDVNGVFFKEADFDLASPDLDIEIQNKVISKNLYYININKQTLFDVNENNIKNLNDEIDSLVDKRLYAKEDIYILLQYIKWLESQGYKIKQIDTNLSKIVNIKTDKSIFSFSLNKSYVETLKDYEALEMQDFFKKIDKSKIEKIDLSFNGKIFYKEKLASSTLLTSTSSKININTASTSLSQ